MCLTSILGGNMAALSKRAIGIALGSTMLAAGLASAEEAVLTIDGKTSVGTTVEYTISGLEELGTAVIETTTPWHEGVVRFEGVPLATLAEELGVKSGNAVVLALNNYHSQIPVSDFFDFDPILATKMNGQHMSIKGKGPLFVIYPYDNERELQSELYYSRSVWQVRSITFE